MEMLKRFVKDERGLEASEYALLLALICLGILIAVKGLATAISTRFNATAATINSGT